MGRSPRAGRPPVVQAGLRLGRELVLSGLGFRAIVGIDEVGRGPLAGPVTAAAVILDADDLPDGLADSKVLPAEARHEAYRAVSMRARAVGIGFATPAEIDAINIRQATFLAMRRALAALPVAPDYLLVDGRDLPQGGAAPGLPGEAIIKGDATCASIAAASIVAKVARDRLMVRHHGHDPRYGFHNHKGYATAEHRDALKRHGPSPFHRRSFAPCGPGQGVLFDLVVADETLPEA
ncbi:ribonuclease HII [Lichenihabitans sp. Uapishka_5]|uniref:ribonuclease HII n=1 Tax=Lichenihabitans sp. Uapishka_5 TaxID=3037302 RepID=UPI0029E7DF48|nr:ribonuclease HII [Lichenihabitans sp. Uapishka_5]MDX7951061.1 ribonuclease HII [Lichenihabitans sp. Uapishka_5]